MALEEYRRKRDLTKTPEPAGGKADAGQLRFVVQKHAASRLHYDFRLELGGVLKSWAVPKGPSLNPADKHLAMMVEDHPMDYRLFEGIIPKGNYGAGTVMVWDEGSYSDADNNPDPKAAAKNIQAGLKSGDLKFVLSGHKLQGSFVLARMKTADQDNAWLLIKHKDEYANTRDVTKDDKSVLTKRTMDQIATAGNAPIIDLDDAPKKAQPAEVKPMLATLTAKAFDDPEWLYEIKWDGYRILAHLQKDQVKLMSRNQKDYTEVFAPIAQELASLRDTAVLDGEMVVVDANGRSDFGALQNYQKTDQGELRYFVFDVPYARGHDLRRLPLLRRKEIAAAIIAPLKLTTISDHVIGRGKAFYQAAKQRDLEGVVAKASTSHYEAGRRSRNWLKVKTHQRQEVVIGGYTEPRGSRRRIGALVMGVYEGGDLRYIGHTGGGLSDKELVELHEQLEKIEQPMSPFSEDFKTNAPVHWVKPTLLAEVEFAEWTSDGHLRQPRFIGLRQDKDAKTVVREQPVSKPKAIASAKVTTQGGVGNRDKIFWPKEGYTKGDLADYYQSVADTLIPHIAGRPESMNRYPDGINGPSFFHKDLEKHPDWIKTQAIHSESNDKDMQWLIADDLDSLLYMVNLGCIELNPWHSRVGSLEKPDYCLIDLDAKTNDFSDIITVARETHKLLEELKVPNYPKTSGKTGMHVCIPLGAKYSYEQSKQFAEILVNLVNQRLPKLTSVVRSPEKRTKKIYLDYLQNRKGQTMAAAYCVRPVLGAAVSTPLDWSEVKAGLDPTKFTIKTTTKRLAKVGDLWKPVIGQGVDMKSALDQISS